MASIALRHIYNHHMVFQQGQPIPVAGTGTDGDIVTVTLGDRTATATVENGAWSVALPPMSAGFTPYTLTASTNTDTVTLTDILIGEVWIMTGQSNNAYQIDQITEPSLMSALIDHVRDDAVRSVTTCHCEAPTELGDLAKQAVWHRGTDDVLQEGALGIALAKYLRDALNVPVAAVTASWGGSYISQWIGDNGMGDFVYCHTAKCWRSLRYAGMLWYQGEADAPAALNVGYADRFGILRDRFMTDFDAPSLDMFVVQLPNFAVEDPDHEYGWVAIRRVQETLMDIFDRVHTVCTIDMGEKDNIHPNDKLSFAKRVAGQVLRRHYGDTRFAACSPRATAIKTTDTGWVVTFDMEGALVLTEGDTIYGLALETADGTRVPAIGRITGPDTVAVERGAIVDAKKMQYLGENHNAALNLCSNNGLPAFPFAFSL